MPPQAAGAVAKTVVQSSCITVLLGKDAPPTYRVQITSTEPGVPSTATMLDEMSGAIVIQQQLLQNRLVYGYTKLLIYLEKRFLTVSTGIFLH